MKDAISIARMVSKTSDEKMDKHADETLGGAAPERDAPGACCGDKHDK